MDGTRFPRISRYLAGLPRGLGAYPECQAKASMLRFVIARSGYQGSLHGLDPRLASLIADPPPATSWISEVEYGAACLALADLGELSLERFGKLWYGAMLDLTDSRLYRTLLGLITPTRLLKTSADRWSMFHRGTRLRATMEERGLVLEMLHPIGLLDHTLAHGYSQVFQALVHRSTQKQARVSLQGREPSAVRWLLQGFSG